MARLDLDELVEHFTLLPDEVELLGDKAGASRLGFALLLKHFTRAGRFPAGRGELAEETVEFVARQVGVPAPELRSYDWSGRTIKRHRAEVRRALGFRECSVEDADKLTEWLAGQVAEVERRPELVRSALLERCREQRLEPPTPGQVDRMVASALRRGERALFTRMAARLPAAVAARLRALVAVRDEDDGQAGGQDGDGPHAVAGAAGRDGRGGPDPSLLTLIRSEPGAVSLESMLAETEKLLAIRDVGLGEEVFDDVAPRVLENWRAQAMVEAPSHLRAHPEAKTLTLLAALVHTRRREVTDALVDLLISTVHRIGARAERKVTEELVNAFKRVTGKENILFAIAGAAIARPDESVRDVVFPAVTGGEATLQELVHEYKTKGPIYQRTVKTTLRASYTNHYRRGLIRLLEVLEFRSGNTHRPVLEALELVARHSVAAGAPTTGNRTYFPAGEHVPTHAGLGGAWEPLVWHTDGAGRRRARRMTYEIATFQALRERLRCKDIWVVGADRWRNPDADLPGDFDERRVEHYRELRKPLDPTAFINQVHDEMAAELDALETALPDLAWLEVAERAAGAIKLTPLDAVPEPTGLRRLKAEVARRWGAVPLVDMLKEAVLRTGCLDAVSGRAGGASRAGAIDARELAERLVLVIYGYGTNTGLRSVAAAGRHGHTEDDLRYVRRRYLTLDAAREIAVAIADATFTARREAIWGAGSSTVASDSTHVAALDQNLLTQWHSRYGGRGVLIYWHVERDSMAVHSQLISCTASEVAAMVEGAVRHGTTMALEGNYVDSHGQSEIGFGITRLLGFELLPRIKAINKVKLYRLAPGETERHPGLAAAMTRPIRWELIAQQYDQMIKYATAIRTGTATTEAILRRFTRTASHPTYQAMLELGRAQKTIFTARYLRSRELQREINSGLNVVESWNRANSVIAYGKGGGLATNRRDEQEMIVACLRILQSALVYVNTLMLQDVLDDPTWSSTLDRDADRRGLSPLFWSHVLPYGEVRLDMTSRLALT